MQGVHTHGCRAEGLRLVNHRVSHLEQQRLVSIIPVLVAEPPSHDGQAQRGLAQGDLGHSSTSLSSWHWPSCATSYISRPDVANALQFGEWRGLLLVVPLS